MMDNSMRIILAKTSHSYPIDIRILWNNYLWNISMEFSEIMIYRDLWKSIVNNHENLEIKLYVYRNSIIC